MRRLITLLLIILLPALVFSATMEFLQPQHDTYICNDNPDFSYGSIAYIAHGLAGSTIFYALIQWDISGLPADITIDGATMELYCSQFVGTESGDIYYYIITDAWDESTVTWNTTPNYSTSIQTTTGWPTADTWFQVDVMEFVQNWYNSTYTNYGIYWVFVGTTGYCFEQFHSKESADPTYYPKLTVEFTYNAIQSTSLGQIKSLYE